jgi:hypothetical protein
VREGESEGKEKSKFLPCPYASMKRNFNLHVGFELEKLVNGWWVLGIGVRERQGNWEK